MIKIVHTPVKPIISALGALLALSACQTLSSSDPIALEAQSRAALHAGAINPAMRLTQQLIAERGPTPSSLNQMSRFQVDPSHQKPESLRPRL